MKNYAIGLYEKTIPKDMKWEGKLKCAKECGYDFLEISIDGTEEKLSRLDWTKEQRMDMLQLMQKNRSAHSQYVPFQSQKISLWIFRYGNSKEKLGNHGENH